MSDSNEATLFVDLAAEVEIPPEGTLSRVLYKDDRLRTVLFAFDVDQELTDHQTAMAVVLQVVSGSMDVTFGAESARLGAGSWLRMPANLSHSVRALSPSVMLLTLHKETANG